MPSLTRQTARKFQGALSSLAQLYAELDKCEWEISESLLVWFEVDRNEIEEVLQEMEKEYYAESS